MKFFFCIFFLSCFLCEKHFADELDFLKGYQMIKDDKGCVFLYNFDSKSWKKSNIEQDSYLEISQFIDTGILTYYRRPIDQNHAAYYFDFDGSLKKIVKINLSTPILFSYDGKHAITDQCWINHECFFGAIKVTPDAKVFPIERTSDTHYDLVFLRDNQTVLYIKADKTLWSYNVITKQREKIATFNQKLSLGGVAYKHPWVLCNSNESVYIFDYEKKELKLIKKYPDPGFFSLTRRFDNKPSLVAKAFCWREDDKGFLLVLYDTSIFNFNLKIIENYTNFFLSTSSNTLTYYYDLDSGKEFLLEGVFGFGWRQISSGNKND